MIARLIDGNIIPCPKQGRDGQGRFHTNLSAFYEDNLDAAAADGFYPVRNTDKPEGDYRSAWTLENGEIVQSWSPYTPEPEPMQEPDPYQMRADIDYIAMMGDFNLGGGTV